MTRDDIIRMAREAADPDAVDPLCGSDWGDLITLDLDEMVRFAALVAAHEREACAEVCEMQMNAVVARHPARIEFDPDNIMAQKCAAAIRNRGKQK